MKKCDKNASFKKSKRIGAAEKEMKEKDITQEELNNIPLDVDFGIEK